MNTSLSGDLSCSTRRRMRRGGRREGRNSSVGITDTYTELLAAVPQFHLI
jgi:hypothetical protein